jgi:chemotaxis protein MotB
MADLEELEEIALAGPKKASEDPPALDCPPCKAGSPAWMATFADMATLLMAFFVLILSFAHLNVPKFKNVSGSMRMAFGVQMVIPVIEPPEARNLVATQYMTAQVDPTPLQTIEEQRTDDPQPVDPELNVDVAPASASTNAAVESLQNALADQIAMGKVSVSVVSQTVTVNLLEPDSLEADNSRNNQQSAGQINAELLEIFAAVVEASLETSVNIEVLAASSVEQVLTESNSDRVSRAQASSPVNDRFEMIRANLANEIRQGLAEVSRVGDDIIIRLAEQGTFASGRAELQATFAPLLDSVGASLAGITGTVSIEGHSDNVPIGPGGRFRTNWDLSSARAAAVADYLLTRSSLNAGQVSVSGFADTRPIADNNNATGRAQNRRIEIIVSDR